MHAKEAGQRFTCTLHVLDGDADHTDGLSSLLWLQFTVKPSDDLSDKLRRVSIAPEITFDALFLQLALNFRGSGDICWSLESGHHGFLL